jgi:hypothetical protein
MGVAGLFGAQDGASEAIAYSPGDTLSIDFPATTAAIKVVGLPQESLASVQCNPSYLLQTGYTGPWDFVNPKYALITLGSGTGVLTIQWTVIPPSALVDVSVLPWSTMVVTVTQRPGAPAPPAKKLQTVAPMSAAEKVAIGVAVVGVGGLIYLGVRAAT